MLKWVKAFHKTISSKGKDLVQFTYGTIFMLVGVTICTIAEIFKNDWIAWFACVFLAIGLTLWLVCGYNDSKEDIKKFFKEVKNNIK
jgi:hypothetical protein